MTRSQTRKMINETQNNTEDKYRMKTLQNDLNKSLQLNEKLLKEQDETESDFKMLLDSNKRLKKDMIELEKKYLEIVLECEDKDHKIVLLTAEHEESDTLFHQKHKLDQCVQKLQEEITRLEQINKKLENDIKVLEHIHSDIIAKLNKDVDNLKRQNDRLSDKITGDPKHIHKTEDGHLELKKIRSELKFKNAELKTLRKKNKMPVKVNKAVKKSNDNLSEDLNNFQHLYDDLLEKSNANVNFLEENMVVLKAKIKTLEGNCDCITKSYDDLSIINKNNEKEKSELLETLDEIENILQEDIGIDISEGKLGSQTEYNDINHHNDKLQTTIILGNECAEGLGMYLNQLLDDKVNFCCFTYRDASVRHLIENARQMAVSNTSNVKTIVLITRKVHYKSGNTYIDDLISLHKFLKDKNIRLVCTNISYTRGTTSMERLINEKTYECNTKLHTYANYEKSLDVINVSGVRFQMTSKNFRIMIANYMVTFFSNILNNAQDVWTNKQVF